MWCWSQRLGLQGTNQGICNKRWRQKSPEDCFSMQILYSVEKHATKMLQQKYLESYPSYIGTSVCSEWLSATAFKKWMEEQDLMGKCLDKDIIVPGNRLYSPETCAFVLNTTNLFVLARDASRGEYPIGVHLFKRTGKYQAYCKNPFTGKQEHLGYFSTPEEAHEAWRKRKHDLAQRVAATESDMRVVEALRKRYSLDEWYKSITPA